MLIPRRERAGWREEKKKRGKNAREIYPLMRNTGVGWHRIARCAERKRRRFRKAPTVLVLKQRLGLRSRLLPRNGKFRKRKLEARLILILRSLYRH